MSASTRIEGRDLTAFVRAVRDEYWQRPAFGEYREGIRQANLSRVIACEVLEERSPAEQMAIVADIYRLDGFGLACDPAEVFSTAATTGEILFDLICEVCWQTLAQDLAIRVEDEVRSALADA